MVVDERLTDDELIEEARRAGYPITYFCLTGVKAYGDGPDRAKVDSLRLDERGKPTVTRFNSRGEFPNLRVNISDFTDLRLF